MRNQAKALRKATKRIKIKLFNDYTVFKNFLALILLAFSFFLLEAVLRNQSDIIKLVLVIYGTIVGILCLSLIAEFLLKTVRLQNDSSIVRYSALVSFNGFLALVINGIFLNLILAQIMRLLLLIADYDTFWCEFRRILTQFYYRNEVYWQLNSLIGVTLVILVSLFIWGGALERMLRKRSN